ncbi:PQQ-dependent sugar dehydrogenase [Ferruginibacter sp.]
MLRFLKKTFFLLFIAITTHIWVKAQAPSNDNCANAILLTSNISCSGTTGTIANATPSITPTSGSTCTAWSTNYDVWYKFVAVATTHTITISNFEANFWSQELQVYSSCPSVATGYLACSSTVTNGSVSVSPTGLTIGNTYYIRVSNLWNSHTSTAGFTICVTHPLTAGINNTCANAVTLTAGLSCSSMTANLQNANSAAPAGCTATNTTTYDVWFKFTATATVENISLSNLGSNVTAANTYIETFSGACGGLTSLGCQTAASTQVISGLSVGTVYYTRVYVKTNPTATPTSSWTFDICVYSPIFKGGRTNEVFKQTLLVSNATSPASNRLYDPWEVTYGPDDSLWVTEAKGYKVKKINPVDGGQRTILDLSDAGSGGSFTPSTFRRQFAITQNPWPQGGMMGLAIHPDFNAPVSPKKYVYIAYVNKFIPVSSGSAPNQVTNYAGEAVKGYVFETWLVRFTYDGTNLVSPVALCDTIRGSNDHNSGRLIIKPVGGVPYLFYALGDMGAGQFDNINRTEKAQLNNSYEGKILRFNLETDGDAGSYDQWIPNNNPFNTILGVQSAVWSTGIRNNQGFAYNAALDLLYGASHGPFSDDEFNIIEPNRNYGHPLVIGDSSDGNYNNAKAGPISSSLPLIFTERSSVLDTINVRGAANGTTYKNTLYSFYPVPAGNTSTAWSIQYIYNDVSGAQNANINWYSEAISGLDIYTKSLIPGWRNSLLAACLKGGRIMRTKLNTAGTAVVPTDGADTVTYFRSVNRFRDMAISPDGRNIYTVIDSSSTTSGPTTANPSVSACRGCLQRYTFLGYDDASGASTISTNIPIAPGMNNQLTNGTATSISSVDNSNLWVPVTDSLGNIIAEIDANGNNLGNITSTLYKNSGAIRTTYAGTPYADRSITISVQTPPSTAVNVRLYLTAAELAALVAAPGSNVTGINNVQVYKNSDANGTTMTTAPTAITPSGAVSKNFNGDYVLTVSVTGFSTFYFAGSALVLPLDQITLTGRYDAGTVPLQWKTENENSVSHYIVEKSLNGQNFSPIGSVVAIGNTSNSSTYNFRDNNLVNDFSPVLYYRIKVYDQNGAFKYSNTISVTLPSFAGNVTVSPNPATDKMNALVLAPADGRAEWSVIDITGRTLLSGTAMLKKGNNQLPVSLGKLAAGTYFLHITGANIQCETKFQKQL